jgi:hypothetical protein
MRDERHRATAEPQSFLAMIRVTKSLRREKFPM